MSLVTVIIPTLRGRRELLRNALESVAQQTVGQDKITVVVSPNGHTDDDLIDCEEAMADIKLDLISIFPLGREWNMGFGAVNRQMVAWTATTEFIAYLDDDNTWRPDHLETLLNAIGSDDFAYSQMLTQGGTVVGDGQVAIGKIDTSVILHRTDLLARSTWNPYDGYIADGMLAVRWVEAKATYVFVPRITVDYSYARVGRNY